MRYSCIRAIIIQKKKAVCLNFKLLPAGYTTAMRHKDCGSNQPMLNLKGPLYEIHPIPNNVEVNKNQRLGNSWT